MWPLPLSATQAVVSSGLIAIVFGADPEGNFIVVTTEPCGEMTVMLSEL